MNLGILTHPLANNYGGILQNFALQQVLLRQGHKVATVDLRFDYKVPFIRMFAGWMNRMRLYYLQGQRVPISFNPSPSSTQYDIINQHTQHFVRTKINRTGPVRCWEDLSAIDEKYQFDTYVIGSDQVWNRNLCPWYFGSFIKRENVKLIAYAASFGYDDWKMDTALTTKCSDLVKKFSAISVREDSAVDLCRNHLGVNAVHVIDPTMLLTKEDYLKEINVLDEENILFSYILDNNEDKSKIVSAIASQKELDVRTCMPEEEFLRGISKIDNCIFPSVDKWLNGFNNAKFVVTDSFHGTVFAILFNVPFVAIGNRRRGLARFESLLRMFGLEERLVTSIDEAVAIADASINYAEINAILENERIKAFDFLSVLA